MVVIKDMNMPENCKQCNFECVDYYGDTMYCYCPYIYNGYTDNFRDNKRHEECPLSAFELCEDVISRQAAIETIRKLPNAGIHWLVSAEAVFDALLKLPPAESGDCNECAFSKIC